MAGWAGFTIANEILDFYYRGVAITIGSSLWIRILVSPSSRSGGGTETNYSGYARYEIVRTTSGLFAIAPSNGQLTNSAIIELPTANSLGNGDLNSFDIVNTASGAFTKIYNGGPIIPAVSVIVGKKPTFGVGKLFMSF